MLNIKLVIAYDGTPFLGWQKSNKGNTIEESLQKAIEKILQHPVSLQAASRTDAGVHAKGQVVNFFTQNAHLNLDKFLLSLNRLLPKEIVVIAIDQMPLSFHPTLDCIAKEYRYHVCYGTYQLPHRRQTSWHVHYELNLALINEALPFLIGTHSFEAFCNKHANSRYTDFIREIERLECIELENKQLCFKVKGKKFLYKMVRNLIGTLVYVGRGKILPTDIPNILLSGKRIYAGVTAPAHGLFLNSIIY